MKILRLFLVASFTISLLAGLWAGTFIFQKRHISHQTNEPTQTVASTLGKQEGIWLIAVDQLNVSAPQIKGIWLLAYIPSYVKLKLLPLYPTNDPQHDSELVNTFRIVNNQQIAPEFWDYLQKHGQTVRNYIIFDAVSAAEIINYFGGVTIQGKHLNGFEVLVKSPDPRNDPQSSIKLQIDVMDSLCKSIFSTQPVPDFNKLQIKIKNHILSNLDLAEKLKEWRIQILNGDHKICDFSDLVDKPPISPKP